MAMVTIGDASLEAQVLDQGDVLQVAFTNGETYEEVSDFLSVLADYDIVVTIKLGDEIIEKTYEGFRVSSISALIPGPADLWEGMRITAVLRRESQG